MYEGFYANAAWSCTPAPGHNAELKMRGRRQKKKEEARPTSGTDTAADAAAGGWLSVAGFQSVDRPRPLATPRCRLVAVG